MTPWLVGCHLLVEEHLNSFLPQSQVTHRDTVPSNKPTSFPPGLPPKTHRHSCLQADFTGEQAVPWVGSGFGQPT